MQSTFLANQIFPMIMIVANLFENFFQKIVYQYPLFPYDMKNLRPLLKGVELPFQLILSLQRYIINLGKVDSGKSYSSLLDSGHEKSKRSLPP
jgi:hypothetical protein